MSQLAVDGWHGCITACNLRRLRPPTTTGPAPIAEDGLRPRRQPASADADGGGVCDDEFEVRRLYRRHGLQLQCRTATDDDGSCTYRRGRPTTATATASHDADGDGVCDDEFEVRRLYRRHGLQLRARTTTDDDGSCTYAEDGLDRDGNCLADADGDGICDDDEVPGCGSMAWPATTT